MYSPQPTPKRIAAFGDRKVERVACGHQHTLAITADGAGFTWGEGSRCARMEQTSSSLVLVSLPPCWRLQPCRSGLSCPAPQSPVAFCMWSLQLLHDALSAAQGTAAALMLPAATVQAFLSCIAALQAANHKDTR